jgi:hypothetical protein
VTNQKNEAERLRFGIRGGWLPVGEAVAWADAEISKCLEPAAALIEVASASKRSPQDVANLLEAVPGASDRIEVMRRCLGDLLDAIERQPALSRDAARWLEASAIEGELPGVDFGYEPTALADAFALAEAGTYGTVREARERLLAFLREHGKREA